MKKTGILRWAFNVASWDPSEAEWEKCMELLSGEPAEQERIKKFVRPLKGGAKLVGRHNPDAKSSLAGRLLIRKAVTSQLGVPCNSTTVQRTRLGKPYVVPTTASPLPNFNVNVAHQGDWVVLAAEPHDLVGVDVMKNELRPNTTIEGFLSSMRSCFTDHEWLQANEYATPYNPACGGYDDDDDAYSNDMLFAAAMSYGTPPASRLSAAAARLDPFFTLWCLKESLVKATGLGLSFGLDRTSFTFTQSPSTRFEPEWVRPKKATVLIDGVTPHSHWDFNIESLDDLHIVACARTAPCEAADKETVWPECAGNKGTTCNAGDSDNIARPPFEEVTIDKLML